MTRKMQKTAIYLLLLMPCVSNAGWQGTFGGLAGSFSVSGSTVADACGKIHPPEFQEVSGYCDFRPGGGTLEPRNVYYSCELSTATSGAIYYTTDCSGKSYWTNISFSGSDDPTPTPTPAPNNCPAGALGPNFSYDAYVASALCSGGCEYTPLIADGGAFQWGFTIVPDQSSRIPTSAIFPTVGTGTSCTDSTPTPTDPTPFDVEDPEIDEGHPDRCQTYESGTEICQTRPNCIMVNGYESCFDANSEPKWSGAAPNGEYVTDDPGAADPNSEYTGGGRHRPGTGSTDYVWFVIGPPGSGGTPVGNGHPDFGATNGTGSGVGDGGDGTGTGGDGDGPGDCDPDTEDCSGTCDDPNAEGCGWDGGGEKGEIKGPEQSEVDAARQAVVTQIETMKAGLRSYITIPGGNGGGQSLPHKTVETSVGTVDIDITNLGDWVGILRGLLLFFATMVAFFIVLEALIFSGK